MMNTSETTQRNLLCRNMIYGVLSFCVLFCVQCDISNPKYVEWAIAIHGGAGAIHPHLMTKEKDSLYRQALSEALSIGEKILQNGGTSLEAVEKTIIYLEDNPLFNAGRGAVFSYDEKNELDASIMDGSNLKAGAVGSVSTIKNPIRLAKAVMENSPHVFLVGRGAEQFAMEQGIDTVSADWFFTMDRWESLMKIKNDEKILKDSIQNKTTADSTKYGTVGCVALDKKGNLSAGTSTGGMTNKRWNRLGDSPVIGSGTYADNNTAAISCTGHGEYFIRYVVAYDVCALMEYKKLSLAEATQYIIYKKLKEAGGEGGLIALDKNGNIVMPFNSAGMYRASAKPGNREIKIYEKE